MRIIIADDEYWAQEYLIDIINHSDPTWSIVGVASQGKELEEMVMEQRPDVAIIDIHMPEMSGLQAYQACKARSPETQWIILTGYEEFHYALEAIKLGVRDYLTKPVEARNLEQIIRRLDAERKLMMEGIQEQVELSLRNAYYGGQSDSWTGRSSLANNCVYQIAIIYADSFLEKQIQERLMQQFVAKIQALLPSREEGLEWHWMYVLPSGDLCSVMVLKKDRKENGRYRSYACELETMIRQASRSEWAITVITHEQPLRYCELGPWMYEARSHSPMRMLHGTGRVWRLQEMAAAHLPGYVHLFEVVNRLVSYYKHHKLSAYVAECNRLLDLLIETKMDSDPSLQLIKQGFYAYLQLHIPVQLRVHTPVLTMISSLIQQGYMTIAAVGGEEKRDLIERVRQYIEQNYMNNLSISGIAQEFYMSPNYLSTLFHRKVGTPFLKYVTNIRIQKAQSLLTETDKQIQEVAYLVGYYSQSHFIKTFREYTGYYPSDYPGRSSKRTLKREYNRY